MTCAVMTAENSMAINQDKPPSSPDLPSAAPCPANPSAVTHNSVARRFELRVGDAALAFLSYKFGPDHVNLDHTFVPDEFRGRGIAEKLVRAALHEAHRRGWRIIPRCSYVSGFIDRNPEFGDLLCRELPP